MSLVGGGSYFVQNNSEPIEQFVTRLRKLSLYCEYGDKTDEHIRDQVIASCTSTKLRQKLLDESNLDQDKTISLCKIMEAVNLKSDHIESTNNDGVMVNKMNYHQRSEKYQLNKNYPKHNYREKAAQPPRSQVMCGCCGAMGHTSKDCKRTQNKVCDKCKKP